MNWTRTETERPVHLCVVDVMVEDADENIFVKAVYDSFSEVWLEEKTNEVLYGVKSWRYTHAHND
jgi:hypothetical protein